MPVLDLLKNFDNQPDSDLTWFCPPRNWSLEEGGLTLFPEAKTDYWQRTHYGFQNDNGHFLYTEIEGDFILTTKWYSR